MSQNNNQELENLNNAARMSPEEQAIAGLFTTSLLAQPVKSEIRKHAGDIRELKEQLEQKDAEIDGLRLKLRKLEENNNNLLIKLEAKDDEVKTLKERIRKLEEEKKTLQEELASVQFKLKGIEEEVKTLRKLREDDKEKSSKQDEELKKIHYSLQEVKDDLAATKSDNEVLKKQVRHQSRYVAGAPPLMPVEASEDRKALRNLGEMCCQIQDEFYRRTLPDHFTPVLSYKIATLKRDIKKLCKTEEEKRQALKRWEDLKATIPLKEEDEEELEEVLNALQNKYKRCHDTNPPKLSEKLLKKSAELLDGQNILKGWISLKRVNGLILIWKKLDCDEN